MDTTMKKAYELAHGHSLFQIDDNLIDPQFVYDRMGLRMSKGGGGWRSLAERSASNLFVLHE
jgi:hypothetical protein